MVATELLKLAMETEEGRKERLKKMVANHSADPETEDERRARLEYLSDNPIYIPNNLYLILIVAFEEVSSLIKLTRTIHFLEQFIIYNACMYLCMYTNII